MLPTRKCWSSNRPRRSRFAWINGPLLNYKFRGRAAQIILVAMLHRTTKTFMRPSYA
ncbi:protein of unknown function [Pseudomonas sp. JV551A1]|nr:protein of unknown function [Pseudomonas sp. JV551A1]